jgi:ABC-type nitrate/sulfonate/bicarbonate transport system substrate-binding protein
MMSSRDTSSVTRRLVAFVALFALLLTLASCGTQESGESQTLNIGAIPLETATGPVYAQEQGYWEEHNLNIELQDLGSGPAIVSAVASGELDIGFSNPVSVADAYAKGLPLVILWPAGVDSTDRQLTGLIVAEDSQIQSGGDLNGSTFGLNGLGGMPHIAVQEWIDENGGDSSTVEFVELSVSQTVQGVAEGRVDGGYASGPYLEEARQNDDVRIIANGNEAISDRFVSSVWFTTSDWVEDNPEAAEAFIQVMQEAHRWANENPDESLPIMTEYTGISTELANSMDRADLGETSDPTMIQPALDSAAKYAVLERPVDANDIWHQQ